eukprot:2898194-Rhodomonas_salina.2
MALPGRGGRSCKDPEQGKGYTGPKVDPEPGTAAPTATKSAGTACVSAYAAATSASTGASAYAPRTRVVLGVSVQVYQLRRLLPCLRYQPAHPLHPA